MYKPKSTQSNAIASTYLAHVCGTESLDTLAEVASTMSYERAQPHNGLAQMQRLEGRYCHNPTACTTVPATPTNPSPLNEAIFEDDREPLMFDTEPTTNSDDEVEWECCD